MSDFEDMCERDIDAEIAKDDAADEMERLRAENTQLAAAFHRLSLCIPLPLAIAEEIKAGKTDEALLSAIERQLRSFHELRETNCSSALRDLLAPTIDLIEDVRDWAMITAAVKLTRRLEAELARLRAVTGGQK